MLVLQFRRVVRTSAKRAVVFALLFAAAGALSGGPAAAGPAAKDPGVSEVKVKVDEIDFKKVLSVKVGELYADQLTKDDPFCKAAAVLVAQEAVDRYGSWTAFLDLLKQTAAGIELGATLGGAKSVAKVAQLAGTIVEAFDQDDPAAALGQALIKETTGWLAGKAKSGNETVDDAVKSGADKARDALIQALFPGKTQKASTYSTAVGNCKVFVTPEFEWPGPGKGSVGGVRLYVSGDCECRKPLQLNGGYLPPTNFRAQADSIKNSGLGRFALIAFLPMTRLETFVSYGGTPIDLTKLMKTASKLKKAVDDAMAGSDSEEDPRDIAGDLQDQVGKATDIKATLTIRPVFAEHLTLETLHAECGNCPQPGTTVTEGGGGEQPGATGTTRKRPVEEVICENRCGEPYRAWQAEQRLADALDDTAAGLERAVADDQRDLRAAQDRLDAAKKRQAAADKNVQDYRDTAAAHGQDPSFFGEKWKEAQRHQAEANRDVADLQARANRLAKDLAQLQAQAAGARARAKAQAAGAAAARTAYYECTKRCWDEARLGNPSIEVPEDVRRWEKAHPSSTGQAPPPQPTKSMTVGVVVPGDAPSGCTISGRVVENPKDYERVPTLRTVEVELPVPIGDDGRARLDEVRISINDGPSTPGDHCATGTTSPSGPTKVSVRCGDGPAVTREFPTSGQPPAVMENPAPSDFATTPVVQPGAIQVVRGPFHGNAFYTDVTVGGTPAAVVAEQPGRVFVRIPGTVQPGRAEIVCREGGASARLSVYVLTLQMSADRLELKKGQSTGYAVVLSGLEAMPQDQWRAGALPEGLDPALLHRLAPSFRQPTAGEPGKVVLVIQNMSPEVVAIDKGLVEVRELGPAAFKDGPFKHTGTITAHRAGGFSVTAIAAPFIASVTGAPLQ